MKETISTIITKQEIKFVKKGTILQKKGDKKIKAFHVISGLLRSYTIDENGKEHIFMFAPENWLITDVSILTKQSDAVLYIDALEHSEIEIVHEKLFENVEQLPIEILSSQINKLINRINVLQKRVLLLLSASAEERYLDFINTYPQLLPRVSQKMIASYLGITPEVLSRVRKNISTKKTIH